MPKNNPMNLGQILMLGLCLAGFTAGAQVTYDLSADFSATSNPAGVWSYGAKASLSGTFDLFTVQRTVSSDNGVLLNVWQLVPYMEPTLIYNGTSQTATSNGGQGVYGPGAFLMFAGTDGAADGYGVARFTTPTGGTGTYQLSYSARSYLSGSLSGDTDFHIFKNGSELFGQFLAGNSSTSSSLELSLLPGDVVDFVVGRGTDGSGNNSGLILGATLTMVPEPSLSVVLLLGGAFLALRKRVS